MFNVDKSVLDTQGKLLFNISEQLNELIGILRPQKVKEEVKEEVKCPKCGKAFEKPNQLRGHMIKCKG
ncbi:MAG: hypothetical protein PHE17_21625 [Thiothrix sp.]|uniref:hypothetical protein n=1 Tax=Thiothrix sp. TaxID=1032 RepID=UPI002636FB4F|nr:hypothetical protein [Thiothrix sp.]MDD5395630.1 hypothetical protein [Thiothrix sp.]